MNFRVESSIENAKELVNRKEYNKLFDLDQLNQIIKRNEITFNNFKEMKINFPPTYKFDLNTDNYDTSAKKRFFIDFYRFLYYIVKLNCYPNRVPSWCDRILYKTNEESTTNDCSGVEYDHIINYKQSDHKPVYGIFKVKVI